jgi:hypothetical protein
LCDCLLWAVFLIKEVWQLFELPFSAAKLVFDFGKKCFWATFWATFSPSRLVTLLEFPTG